MIQHYLAHAVSTSAPLASAVRLKMHGEIRLKRWYPYCLQFCTRTAPRGRLSTRASHARARLTTNGETSQMEFAIALLVP
jgi:hypothetical protein